MQLFTAIACVTAAILLQASPLPSSTQVASALAVRSTSPLGRTGIPGKVRVVAQVHAAPGAVLHPVQFFVDGTLLGVDRDGPPYAADWEDANPFEPRKLSVEVSDDHGNIARDAVALKPLEVAEKAEVMSVLLDVTVHDAKGRFVRNLPASQFDIREDGTPQQLELARQEVVPATIARLIDASQSMSRRMDFVKEAAARLTGYMSARDRMLIVPFSKTLQTVTGPTNDKVTIQEAIGAIVPRGGTAIMDSVVELTSRMRNIEGHRAVVLLTDGYDEHSAASFDDALAAVKESQTTVYVVGIGGAAGVSLRGERQLRQLATETGGRAFLPSNEDQLATVRDVLADDVHNKYLLTYTPGNQERDGGWRSVSVMTRDASLKVRTRSGYFAPKPPPIRPTLEFTVSAAGRAVLDLTAADLTLTENGVPQKIESFHESVTPVSVVLALDASGSMKKATDPAKEAARRFVSALRPEDQLATVLFADKTELAHDLSVERSWAFSAIDDYVAAGGTALYDALASSIARLKSLRGHRVVVLVTDGRDENDAGTAPGSRATFSDVLRAVEQSEVIVYTIGIGANVDQSVLQKVADVSGGEAYFPLDVTTLDEQYRRVVEHLRRRWVVSYTSSNSKHDGAWRPVEIQTRVPNATVKSRGGYFAPGK